MVIASSKNIVDRVEERYAIFSDLLNYDPRIDLISGDWENESEEQMERASRAKAGLGSVLEKTALLRTGLQSTQNFERSLARVQGMLDEYLGSVGAGDFGTAERIVGDLNKIYPDIKRQAFGIIIEEITKDESVVVLTEMTNILKEYEFYIFKLGKMQKEIVSGK
jgi:hypothetical protein